MAAKNIGQLLHALAQHETWHRLNGETTNGTLAWESTLEKAVHWQREAYGAPGVQSLVTICRASAREFGHDWLAEQQAKLIEDRGLSRTKVDAMTAAEIAPHLRKLRNGNASTDPKPSKRTTDKLKNSIVPDDVNSCANYIKEQRNEIAKNKRPDATKKALIAEHLGTDDTEAMERALQPSRFGHLLN